jgi:hypothetical protein
MPCPAVDKGSTTSFSSGLDWTDGFGNVKTKAEMNMPHGIVTAKQVKEMAALLDAYCADHAIPNGPEKEAIGQEILALFNLGYRTRDEIRAALDRQRAASTDR